MSSSLGGMSGGVASASSTATTHWERSPDALWRRTSTGVAVLPDETGAALVFGGLHAALWEALVRPLTIDTLAEHLAAFLADDRVVAQHTVSEVVRFLAAAGVLRESVAPSPDAL